MDVFDRGLFKSTNSGRFKNFRECRSMLSGEGSLESGVSDRDPTARPDDVNNVDELIGSEDPREWNMMPFTSIRFARQVGV